MRTVGPAFYCEGRHSKVRDVPRPPAAISCFARALVSSANFREKFLGEETAHNGASIIHTSPKNML